VYYIEKIEKNNISRMVFMVFSSSIFLFLFLPITLFIYYLLKDKYRNIFLLLVSFVFYAWSGPKYLIVLFGSTLINYVIGVLIGKIQAKRWEKKLILITGVTLNVAMLFYFKYLNFAVSIINKLFGTGILEKSIILPLGISFFVFCGISYIVDIYKGKIEAQRNIFNVALYLSFFPKLSQGPISRYGDIGPQLISRACAIDKFENGIWRLTIGLAKKVIIADQLGQIVDKIYGLPADQNTVAVAWLGSICYTLQIYFDFSGYSDMAIGIGKMFGFDIMENFNYPYISKNISDFWRRWHISLSSWFRDYIYIPLGGNRTGNVYINLLLVFAVTGLWHGAAMNYILWGMWQGLFILIERFMRNHNVPNKLPTYLQIIVTLFITNISWVLFRSPSIGYAIKYLGTMFGLAPVSTSSISIVWYLSPKLILLLIIAVAASIPWKTICIKLYSKYKDTFLLILLKDVCIIVLLFLSIMHVMTSTYSAFIYFKF
jgi:Predicted membrane protein involved in D-alanine export